MTKVFLHEFDNFRNLFNDNIVVRTFLEGNKNVQKCPMHLLFVLLVFLQHGDELSFFGGMFREKVQTVEKVMSHLISLVLFELEDTIVNGIWMEYFSTTVLDKKRETFTWYSLAFNATD